MTQFDSREKSFEKQFEIEEEREFRVLTRAARLFGLWAAEQMGLKEPENEAYAGQAVDSAMDKHGETALIQKIEQDLHARGVKLSRRRLQKEMEGFLQTAQDQLAGT